VKIVVLLYLILLGIWDYRKRSVPLALLILGGILMSGMSVLRCVRGELSCMEMGIGILPGVFMLCLGWMTGKVGYADGIVLVQVGMYLGYKKGALLFCVSMLLLSLSCLILICLKKVQRNTKMPYFPFLAISYLIQIL